MGKKDYANIRLRIIISICIGIALTTAIGIFISSSVVRHFDEDYLTSQVDRCQAMYEQSLNDDTETLSGVITLLRQDKKLQDLFLAGDRDGLFAQSQDTFQQLRGDYRITHFYYHLPDGTNFLRVHTPARHGDLITRVTMQRAMETHKLAAGIELGPLGTFTLRVVVPWMRDGKIIGYLELGEEIEHITTKIASLMQVDLVLIIDKEFTTDKGWLQGQQLMSRDGDWNFMQNHALLNSSYTKIPDAVVSYLQNIIDTDRMTIADTWQVTPTLLARSRPLYDVGGRDLGNFIVLVDTTDSMNDLREANIDYLVYSLGLLLILLAGYWFYLGGVEKTIRIGRKKLAEALAEQQNDKEKLARILSSMAEGFVMTMPSGLKIIQVNQKMTEMIGLPEEEILGRPISDFISPKTLHVARNMISRLSKGQQTRSELTVVSADQQQIPCMVNASPMFNEQGEVVGSFSNWNDISDYKNTLNRLLETEDNFNRVFNTTNDAIALIRGEQFVDCNSAFTDMLGAVDRKEVLNTHPGKLSPDRQPDGRLSREKAGEMIAIALKDGFHRFEWQHKKVNGELFPVEVSLTALQHSGEMELHCLWKDLSKQKEYEQNLLQAAEAARAASRSKDEFLANMSHEIRTPMNGIIGFLRLTLETALADKQREMLDNVLCSAENLLGLLNDILDLAKIEAGQLAMEYRDFNLAVMLDHLISSLTFQAEEKQLYLRNIQDANITSPVIKGDELRLQQIITNLVGNSIKFTESGGITVKVVEEKRQGDDIVLHFSVQDTGIGISTSKQELIFQAFTQADTTTAREYGGTGLGLAISKQLVEMMGGSIWLESEENRGTTFHFTIRVQQGKIDEHPAEQTSATTFSKKLHILLVEDNKFNQLVAVAVFEKYGHRVEVADQGLEALEVLLTTSFDVVFMDVQMPVLDGLTATAIIRNCEAGIANNRDDIKELEEKLVAKLKGKRLPIVAMTANAMSGDRRKCLEAGMDEYLTKPFMPEHINTILARLFSDEEA